MRCPTCKKSVETPTASDPKNPFPFCTERCRLIDLGRWLDGKHQIPAEGEDEETDTLPKEKSDPDNE
jgi:uncharacterized protein